jgi:hypothetical protein
MILCEEKTQQQLPLEGVAAELEASPDLQLKSPPPEGILSTREAARKYHREWSKAHKEKIRGYYLDYKQKNIETIQAKRNTPEHRAIAIARAREWRSDPKNLERGREANRQWQRNHRELVSAYRKSPANVARRLELYQLHIEKNRARARAYSKKPEWRARTRAYCRRLRRESVQFALMDSLRATMNRAFRRNWLEKPARTEALIGCTIEAAKFHIESQFQPGMSWENRGSFVIDHWCPVAAFNLEDSEEVRHCFNWRNLQPLTRHDNAVKSDTLPSPLPAWLPAPIASRILRRMSK